MALRDGLKPTYALNDDGKKVKRKGVFYREHETRKYGVRKDRLYVLRYTIDKQTRLETFGWASQKDAEGNHPYTEQSAEEKIKTFKANASLGTGPTSLADEREVEKRAKRREITVAKLVEEYIKRHAKRNKKSWQEDERALNFDVVPVLGDMLAKDITRQDAANFLEGIVQRGAPVQACNVLEKCRKMFNLAVKWGYVEYNPFAGQERPAPRPERDRVLSDDEIRILWNALGPNNAGISMSEEMRRAFRLILVTGQRPGEVIGMHRREIEGRWWTIPKERSKNKNAHRVYLTDTALELIGEGKGYIFPSPKKDHIDVNAMALSLRRNILGAGDGKKVKGLAGRKKHQAKKKLENPALVNRIGIEHFRPHDLRRTVLTCLARLKVPYEVRERVVNHSLGKLERTYNLHDYDDEKALAMRKWDNRLKVIISGEKERKTGEVIRLAPLA